jgi:Fe-S-cluster-containing dehydrogenase component
MQVVHRHLDMHACMRVRACVRACARAWPEGSLATKQSSSIVNMYRFLLTRNPKQRHAESLKLMQEARGPSIRSMSFLQVGMGGAHQTAPEP